MAESSDGFAPPTLDQAILRQRLLQGVGAGNAVRGSLSKCAIKYREFLSMYFSAEGADAVETAKQDLVRDVDLYQVDMRKIVLSLMAIEEDTRSVETDIGATEDQIDSVRKEIEGLRREHPEAKQIRRNLEEYEALAKMAGTRPSRRLLEKRTAEVNSELQKFESSILKNNERKSLREKQFLSFMRAMLDLKESVDEDAEMEECNEKEDGEEDEGEVQPIDTL